MPYLGNDCRAYSMDLLGFGYSDKPNPKSVSRAAHRNAHNV